MKKRAKVTRAEYDGAAAKPSQRVKCETCGRKFHHKHADRRILIEGKSEAVFQKAVSNLSSNLDKIMTEKGLSQRVLGRMCGLSQATVWCYRVGRNPASPNDRVNISLIALIKLAEGLEVNYLDLLK